MARRLAYALIAGLLVTACTAEPRESPRPDPSAPRSRPASSSLEPVPSTGPSAEPSTGLFGPPQVVQLPPVSDLGDQLVAHVPDVRPCDLVAAESTVWITLPGDRVLAEIDPATNQIARTVPVEISPCSIAFAAGSLWAASGDDLTSELVRVDPATGETLAFIDVPLATAIFAMADAGDGGVWALDRVNGTIIPIDPDTNQAEEPIDLGYGATDMAMGDGVAWISADLADELIRVDIATREVERIPAEFVNGGVAVDDRGAWALDELGDRLTLIDATDGLPILSWEFELEVGHPAAASGGIWMPSVDGALLVFHSETGEVAALYGLPEGFTEAKAGLDSIWLLDREFGGGILRIVPDAVVPAEQRSAAS